MEHPEFVEKAKFIREDEEVDNDLWPRDIIEYNLTKSWQARVRKLRGIIDEDEIEEAIVKGDIYSAMSNSISFVYNSNGVIIYVIVSAELTKYGDYYPTSPRRRDYRFNAVLTNPPFGVKGAGQAPARDDFTISTANKQLNFIQHVMTILKTGGRAAIVVPDNCLFADQAGEVFEILTEDCDLHTVLRLPNGTFTPYSPGTKTNVIFFRKGSPTKEVWIYDARTNIPRITKKQRPLKKEHFEEFEKCYGDDPNGRSERDTSQSSEERWKRFGIDEVRERDFKIDSLKWLRDDSLEDADDLPEPEELATEAISELETAIGHLNAILVALENGNGDSDE